MDLSALGYTQKQREQIKPDAWPTVAQHHAALAGHGFMHMQIIELSKHAASLGTVADSYQAIIKVLPEATHKQIVEVGKQRSGVRARQALLTVAENLRGPPLQLETGQLIRIAKRGGAPVLEAVHALRNALTGEPLHLTPAQVVDIASHDGGKQALETVQSLLPELCDPPYGLTPAQVVGIASHDGGKQALEGVVAQLSNPHPALAAFTNDRLVALACLGGRPALEAVKNGLPRAVELMKKMNVRVPERTAHHEAELGKALQVLSFFQCHSHPTHAFHEAMAEFEMSKQGLIQLFRRVGVTELEALSGTIPAASQRWQRILHGLGMKPPSASVQTPIQESHEFADSLERELDASSPMQDAFPAGSSSRKRSRSDDPVHRFTAQQIDTPRVP